MRVTKMDVWVVLNVFTCGVIGDVEELIVVVAGIGDAMRMVAVLPDLSCEVVANGEGEASLYQLDAALDGVVLGRRDEDVNVLGHDDEAVKLKAALFAVTKERIHHEIGVCGPLKDAAAFVGDSSDGEGLGLNANALGGIGGHISGAKARFVCRF